MLDFLQPKLEEFAQVAKPDDLESVSSLRSVEVEVGKVNGNQLTVDAAE